MYAKTVTYVDFKGTKRTETFYFNLSKSEVLKMEYGANESLAERIKRMMDSNNQPEIMRLFDSIMFQAYGERSEDGREFIKSEEISNKFMHSAAYDAIYVELATDARATAEFINHVIPDMQDVIDKAVANQQSNQDYYNKMLEKQAKAEQITNATIQPKPGNAPVVVDMK